MQVNEENKMAGPNGNEFTPAETPASVESNETINPSAEALPAEQPEQTGKKPLPRWLMPAVAGAAAGAVAVAGIFAAIPGSKLNQRVQSYLNANRLQQAKVVGLQLEMANLGMDEYGNPALTDDQNCVINAMRDQLSDAYGPGYDFDFSYGLPPEGGAVPEYVPFAADAEEDNAGEQPTSTITFPINGDLTPENRDQAISDALQQINNQLKAWGYEPEEATIVVDPTTGEITVTLPTTEEITYEAPTEGNTTGGSPDPTRPSVPATSGGNRPSSTTGVTQKPPATTKAPNTTKKPETTWPKEYTPPQTLRLSPNQVVNGNFDAAFNYIDEDYDKADPMKIEITTDYGTVLAVKRPYAGVNELVIDFYVKTGNGEYVLKKAGVKDTPDGNDGASHIQMVGDPDATSTPDEYYRGVWSFGFCGKPGNGANRRYDYGGYSSVWVPQNNPGVKYVRVADLF
jgi:hypothetical protein